MRIKYIHVKNFKSFNDEIINLENLNILLGANAAGKSNTVSIIRFINHIVQYGLDDAICLLGGINYAINSIIGKEEPIYIKFILDVSDEKWIRTINRKEGYALWLETIESEFEIIPHKRGLGYKIGKEILNIGYKACSVNIEKEKKTYKKSELNYIISYQRVAKKIKYIIKDETKYTDKKLINGMDSDFLVRVINEESKEREELILHRLGFIMPPMFNGNDFIKIYDFDSRLMKTASSITSKRGLEEDGSNIANVLQSILKNKNEKSKLLNLLCDSLPFVEQIDVQNNVDKSVSYRIKETYNSKTFYSNFLSDGTVNILALILALYFEKSSGIIIIEEPERNLHPRLMSKIVEMAKDVSKEKQIIITTHNPEIVKYSDLESVFFAQRTTEGYTKISKPIDNIVVRNFIESDLGFEDLFIKDLLGE